MLIDREREERVGKWGRQREKLRVNLEKSKESEGGFNFEEGRKEGRKDGDFEREREKSNVRKIKIFSI